MLLGDGYVLWLHKISKSFYSDLRDYKFYCFGGIPTYCQVISDRRSNETIDFFDMNWEHQEFTGLTMPHKEFHNSPIPIPIPINDMKKAATKLSQGIPFVRVDFYVVKGRMYFGEMTFYPNCGLGSFKPEKYNNIMGDLLVLP